MTTIVFDNTALNHFARAGRLTELESITDADTSVVPLIVLDELAEGAPSVFTVVSALPWLSHVQLEEISEIVAFAKYKGELGGGPKKNRGEAAVLAWVSVHGGTAIIDEAVGRNIAERDGLLAKGSLWLIIQGYKSKVLDRATAESIVDDLISSGMWLPVTNGAALFTWAYTEGMLP